MPKTTLTANVNAYLDGMREAARKTRTGNISTPLRNSIRSLWTPETSTNPHYLRAIRADKVIVVTIGVALLVTVAGLTACTIGLIRTLAGI